MRLRQLMEGLYHSKARSINRDIYIRHMDAREVLMRHCETDPFHEDTYERYLKIYSEIRESHLSTIYATGSIVDFNTDSLQLDYKNIYVEVYKSELSLETQLDVVPAGDYMCINYYYSERQSQIEKMARELQRKKIVPKLVIEADTFLDIIQYENPLMELQILI